MNFFQSLLSDDPDPPKLEKPHQSNDDPPLGDDHNANDVAQDDNAGGMWSFGSLINNIATRSESVMEAYRRDLEEFGSGLRKETEIFREVASQAVKDLPTSLDGVLKSTAEIISIDSLVSASDGKPETNRSSSLGRYSWFESQLSAIQSDVSTFCEDPEDVEEYSKWRSGFELEEKRDEIERLVAKNGTLEGVYNKVVPSAVDRETFWCRYFYRVEKLKQQEKVRSNLVKRAIPVDDDEDELSWDVDDDEDGNEETSGVKVEVGDAVGDKRAIDGSLNAVDKKDGLISKSRDENEGGNLKGDDGDANRVIESDKKNVENVSLGEKEMKREKVSVVKSDEKVKPGEIGKEKNDVKVSVEEVKPKEVGKEKNDAKVSDEEVKPKEIGKEKNDVKVSDEKVKYEEVAKEKNDVKVSDEKVKAEEIAKEKNDVKVSGEKVKAEEIAKEKNDVKVSEEIKGASVAKSDAAVVSSHKSEVGEEEDLEWDEIEDMGNGDEKKISVTTRSGSPNRADLRKRLSVADDDEDLSWDIEDDDDEPVKA